MLALSGVEVADHLLYLVPTTEPIPDPDTCAPCGSFVRRDVPWHLAASESGGGASTVRILQSDKEGFTLTDKHTMYMKSSGTTDGFPYFYVEDSEYDENNKAVHLNFSNWDFDDTKDMWLNPGDYHVVLDGITLTYDSSAHSSERAWNDGAALTNNFRIFKDGITGFYTAQIYRTIFAYPHYYEVDFKMYKNGSLIDHSAFIADNFDSNYPTRFGILDLTTIFGGLFTEG